MVCIYETSCHFRGIMSSFIPVPNYFDALKKEIGIGKPVDFIP